MMNSYVFSVIDLFLHSMMRRFTLFILSFVILLIAISSCRKDTILTDGSAQLAFTQDTILFDTVFTTIGSVTKHFKILNEHNQPINISAVDLASGTNSNYRINIDGNPGVSFNNIEIPANDSLFVFVEATIDPTGINTPLIVEDSIVFLTNGNEQKVWLHAWGQDAYFHNREQIAVSTSWSADKPHVIYGYVFVDSAQTLTIQSGVTVYSHNNAILYINKASLQADGTLGNPITFRGDRLAPFLLAEPDSVSGQWRGIWFNEALNSTITHTEIKNAIVGIQVDTLQAGEFVNLNKVKVNNSLYASLIGQGNIIARNCLFGNAGNYSGIISYGGDQSYTHCTFGNYWTESDRTTTLFALTDYFTFGGAIYYRPFIKADFINCIFYGPDANDNEITLDTLDRNLSGTAPEFHFYNCLLKTNLSTANSDYYSNCVTNSNPVFTNPAIWDFHIGSGGAENFGSFNLTDDIENITRLDPPDVGCYER
ncbi:MAG: hypothetical protein HOH13_10350 [Crocinitomicaceae bacterium]|jgi:hypothetical protein|nr:hypothetical protein [Crocinitomicaceae bacterium]MBT5402440.1 hypothetical protein [Crocinitomicaceae bacterium]MBT6030698.1 hypothetical protein [Crocinitomicaceae bacterium]MBT6514923.1 hypothetical protein [Crocinitomicaceae bacterium]